MVPGAFPLTNYWKVLLTERAARPCLVYSLHKRHKTQAASSVSWTKSKPSNMDERYDDKPSQYTSVRTPSLEMDDEPRQYASVEVFLF